MKYLNSAFFSVKIIKIHFNLLDQNVFNQIEHLSIF